jgi:hypothetical protein
MLTLSALVHLTLALLVRAVLTQLLVLRLAAHALVGSITTHLALLASTVPLVTSLPLVLLI